MLNYAAPWWLPGGHLQTIWPALYGHRPHPPLPAYRRERWRTPDDDFIDVDWSAGPARETLLVLFHGLEGSSDSHYAQAFADFARQRNFSFAVPHFRGCSGELNRAPRAYHSGDFEEIGWILARLRQRHQGPMLAVGVSLGGNALLRWAEEMGEQAAQFGPRDGAPTRHEHEQIVALSSAYDQGLDHIDDLDTAGRSGLLE